MMGRNNDDGENEKWDRGICVCYKCYVSSFCSDFSANGDDGETETVRGRLQEIIRLMCMVWAKQGLANRLVSGGKKNGGLTKRNPRETHFRRKTLPQYNSTEEPVTGEPIIFLS